MLRNLKLGGVILSLFGVGEFNSRLLRMWQVMRSFNKTAHVPVL